MNREKLVHLNKISEDIEKIDHEIHTIEQKLKQANFKSNQPADPGLWAWDYFQLRVLENTSNFLSQDTKIEIFKMVLAELKTKQTSLTKEFDNA